MSGAPEPGAGSGPTVGVSYTTHTHPSPLVAVVGVSYKITHKHTGGNRLVSNAALRLRVLKGAVRTGGAIAHV